MVDVLVLAERLAVVAGEHQVAAELARLDPVEERSHPLVEGANAFLVQPPQRPQGGSDVIKLAG